MQLSDNRIPGLRVENKRLKGMITLPCWEGHYFDEGKVITDGVVTLSIDGDSQLSDEQVNAYSFLVDNQQAVKQAIVDQLKAVFPQLLANEYASWDHEAAFFPKPADLTPAFDFRNYIGPATVAIDDDAKDGVAYVTWYFYCRWDIEHGIAAITHKDRVIAIAPEVDPWDMYRDNGTYEEKNKAYEEKMRNFTFPAAKKWWEFWKG